MGKEGALLQQQDVEEEAGAYDVEGKGTRFDELRATLARLTAEWRARASNKAREGEAEEQRRAAWRRKLGSMLESTHAHVFIVTLLLFDLLATVIDVLHTLHNDSHDLSRCVAMVEACTCTTSFETSESWEFLYWVGIAVLSVLSVNLLGLLVSFGLAFFRHPGYVLDLVVVVTALCLEIFLDTETAGLLVILNLWRIVRVAHGIFEVTDEAWENKIHQLEARIQAVEAAHLDDLRTIHNLELQVADLQGLPEASY